MKATEPLPAEQASTDAPRDLSSKPDAGPRISTARELAFDLLRTGRDATEFVTRRLDAGLNQGTLSVHDRRLATELVYGIVRRMATLDMVLRPLVRRPPQQIEHDLWVLLRLGAYQLLFLPNIPARAAVHATVELAKSAGEPRWHAFVNGVLRALARQLTDDYVENPSPKCIPAANGRYRQLQTALFPHPDTHPCQYFAAAFSFPEWLAGRWNRRMGAEELFRLGFWFNAPPHLFLRVNELKTTRDAYFHTLESAKIPASAADLGPAIRLEGSIRIENLPGFAEGMVSVQDLSAMHAAEWLDPAPGSSVLDLCAAPGGKTTHLAERMHNQGRIVAVDVEQERLAQVSSACERLGISIVEPHLDSRDLIHVPAGPFDAALVDAPCSNTGVLGKRPEARWRITAADLAELPVLQRRLLKTAAALVRPGGKMLYSTCSIEPEENGDVVQKFLADAPGWRLDRELRHTPGRPADGGYLALLVQST